MDLVFGLAMLLGIAPALILMYIGVRNYTYPKVEQPFFSDPTFFMLLVVGMIAGAILFFAMRMMNMVSNVVFLVIFAIIETLVMVVVMNLRRFRGHSDSVFYGYALGLGIACGLATGIVFTTVSAMMDADIGLDASAIVLVTLSVSMALMYGACGTTVGEGIARHRVMEFALQAAIPLIIYNILMFVLVGMQDPNIIAYYACAVVQLVFSAIVYYRTMYQRLPGIVREVLKMEGKKRDDIPKAR